MFALPLLALGLLVPTPVPVVLSRAIQAPVTLAPVTNIFPTFDLQASNDMPGNPQLLEESSKGDIYSGSASDLELDAMLDNIPASDLDEKGMKKDQRGVEKLKARQAREAARAADEFKEKV